jgi:hypothetical protein
MASSSEYLPSLFGPRLIFFSTSARAECTPSSATRPPNEGVNGNSSVEASSISPSKECHASAFQIVPLRYQPLW